MKQIYTCIILVTFLLCTFNGQAQKTNLIDVLEALSKMDVIIHNKKFKKQLMKDMKMMEHQGELPQYKYDELRTAYNNLLYTYNNDYLSQLKLDLGDAYRLKDVIKNPAQATTRYLDAYQSVVNSYNEEFQPTMLNMLSAEEQENADFITIITIGFKLFRKVVDVIKQRKFQKEDAFNIVMSQVNKRLFKKLELPEWDSFNIAMEGGYSPNDGENEGFPLPPPPPPFNQGQEGGQIPPPPPPINQGQGEGQIPPPPFNPEQEGGQIPPPPPPINQGQGQGQIPPPPPPFNSEQGGGQIPPPPPFSTSAATTISGNFYLEVYDEQAEKNTLLALQEGISATVQVPDFGKGNTSADMILGKPKKGAVRNNTHTLQNSFTTNMTPFVTKEAYPAETYYQIKATGDGFIYLFAINSGNKMYGFFPYMGPVEEIPSGYSYIVPDNANQLKTVNNNFANSAQTIVTIPNEDDYLMTHDPVGAAIPASEKLVLLFSRAELNMKDIFQRMEATSESLSPEGRLAFIFGSQAATLEQGEVRLEQGFFSYQLEEDDPSILPIVISVKRR